MTNLKSKPKLSYGIVRHLVVWNIKKREYRYMKTGWSDEKTNAIFGGGTWLVDSEKEDKSSALKEVKWKNDTLIK